MSGPLRGVIAALPSWLPIRALHRYRSIGGRDRALGLAGQAFLAFIPLIIIWAALSSNSSTAAGSMIRRFHLRGSAADAVQSLFARPPEAGGALTFVGAVVLLASLLSFTKLLQGTWESAWELPSLGLRGAGIGFAGVGLLVLEALLLSLIATALGGTPRAVVTLIRGAAAVPFFLGLQLALLSGRVNWRSLLPGTLVLAVGQAVFTLGSALWMPRLVEHNASRYGVVGVTLALLSWLIVLGILLVAGAAVSAELAHSRAPSVGSVAPADGAAGDADRGTPVRPRPPDPRQDVEEQSLR